jgi:hypothetical protein
VKGENMSPAAVSEVVQLSIGTMLGVALSQNLGRHGLTLSDPKTRWTTLGIIFLYAATFQLIAEPLLSD